MKWVRAMQLNLAKILDQPGAELPFSLQLELHDLEFGGQTPVTEPVYAEGIIRNTAGVLLLSGTLRTTLHCVCDRCATPFVRDYSLPLEAVLVTELQNEQDADEWVFVLENDAVDLDEIVTTTLVLNMDSQLLCREDCKGLCSRCGKNLNEGPCSCKKEIDPRLAVLAQLLEK